MHIGKQNTSTRHGHSPKTKIKMYIKKDEYFLRETCEYSFIRAINVIAPLAIRVLFKLFVNSIILYYGNYIHFFLYFSLFPFAVHVIKGKVLFDSDNKGFKNQTLN